MRALLTGAHRHKGQLVLGHRARLVRHDVLDLSHVLDQIERIDLARVNAAHLSVEDRHFGVVQQETEVE